MDLRAFRVFGSGRRGRGVVGVWGWVAGKSDPALRAGAMPRGKASIRIYFSEQKQQKTFMTLVRRTRWHGSPKPSIIKVFLLLFRKSKEESSLSYLCLCLCPWFCLGLSFYWGLCRCLGFSGRRSLGRCHKFWRIGHHFCFCRFCLGLGAVFAFGF